MILSAPASKRPDDLARWLRDVGQGAAELLQEAAGEPEPDERLRTAAGWLSTDLGVICKAAATYIEAGHFELIEDESDDPERLEDMARLLRVGTTVLGSCSRERVFVMVAIAERLERDAIQDALDTSAEASA